MPSPCGTRVRVGFGPRCLCKRGSHSLVFASGAACAWRVLPQQATGCILLDANDATLGGADRVVIAAGHESRVLAPGFPLQPVRGQVAWGRMKADQALPSIALNGDGYLVAHVPDASGAIWVAGATFDRDSSDTSPRAADTRQNRERLAELHPAAAAALAPEFDRGDVNAWAGVRCASGDRRPLVGPADKAAASPVWLSTALGSRGLSFAALCAELLAGRWHGEPLPLPTSLARSLDTRRT